MKVYIVYWEFDESSGNVAAFSTQEKALDYIKELIDKKAGKPGIHFGIDEMEIK